MNPSNFKSMGLTGMAAFGVVCVVCGILTWLIARKKELGNATALTLVIGGVLQFALAGFIYAVNYSG